MDQNHNWEYDYSGLYQNGANGAHGVGSTNTANGMNGANHTNAASGANGANSMNAASGANGMNGASRANETDAPRMDSHAAEMWGGQAAPGAPAMPPLQAAAPEPGWQPEPGRQPEPQKKKGGVFKRAAAYAALIAVCGAAGFGGGYWGGMLAREEAPGGPVIYQAPAPASPEGGTNLSPTASTGTLSVPEVSAKAGPSVVEVTTEAVTTSRFFGEYVESGAGSGVIISGDGYIITNHHVVSGAAQVRVRLNDGTEYEAVVIGSDSKTDVAVLKIKAEGLSPAVVGDSDSLQVGEFVLAVGNPLGRLGGTVTDGIISALDRDVTVNNQSMHLLQMNAAVSPGNSGGGLFNGRGELIGIVNAKSADTDAEGLGFAIPINTAIRVAEELISNGYVTGRPAMGVTVIDIQDAQTAYQYGVNQAGVYVQSVNENSPAERAGLQPGDRFIGVDGKAVSTTSDITSAIAEHAVGDTIEVQIVRGGQILTASLTLEESHPQPEVPTAEG